MADRQASPGQQRQSRTPTTIPNPNPVAAATSFLTKLQEQAPTSSHLMGFLTLAISGGILLLLSGLTLTVTFLGLIFLAPLIIFTSPIWFPIAAILFFMVAGVLSVGGFGAASVAVLSWLYRYVRGFHPPGSDRVDYARSRIADTASHMKDYAREYGGYLQSKVKDAAPGA